MKLKDWIILIAIIIVLFFIYDVFVNKKHQSGGSVISSDTTIIQKFYFDTVIHQTITNNKTVNLPSQTITVERYGSGDTNTCDSIRTYDVNSQDSNLIIFSNMVVCGKLLKSNTNYKFVKPVRVETIRTIENRISDKGILVGVGGLVNPYNKGEVGLNIGYKNNDFIFQAGYYSNNTVLFSLSKQFFR